MGIWLEIYLLGSLLAFMELIGIYRDNENMVSWVELVVAIVLSIFSWALAIPLFISTGIRNSENKKDDDNLAAT